MKEYFSILKQLNRLQRAAGIMKSVIAVGITLVIVTGIVLSSYSENINRELSDSVVRLHVIANSDSPEDQSLKKDVRDAVLSYIHQELKNIKDIDQTKSIITKDLGKITSLAKGVITEHGFSYNVKATLGEYPFPTKSYGDISLPAGEYQALRVVIGNGEGANWWCVLFPPLCFVDVTHGTVPDAVKEDLKNSLSKEEYNLLTSAEDEGEIPVRIKFKIVELFQDSKIKFTGALNKLFKSNGS